MNPLRPTRTGLAPRSTGGPSPRASLWATFGAMTFVAVALIATGLRAGPELGPRDATFGLPAPPRDLPYDETANLISIAIAAASVLTALYLAIRDWVSTRSAVPLCLVLSAPLIAFPGTVVDVLGGAYMVDGPHLRTLSILGRDMGTFIFAAWSGFAIFLYLVYRTLSGNPRTKVLWWLFGAGCAGGVFSEEMLLPRGSYAYYGNQPLVLVNLLPWWWVVCNIVGCFLAAALAYRYRHVLAGWRAAAVLVVTPMSVLGAYGAAALPSFVAVNGTYPWLLTQVLGLGTVALGVLVFAAILHVVLGRHPLNGEYRTGG